MILNYSVLQKRYEGFILFTLNKQAPLKKKKITETKSPTLPSLTYPQVRGDTVSLSNDQDPLQGLCPSKTSSN